MTLMSFWVHTFWRGFTTLLGWYPLFVVFTWQLLTVNCFVRRYARISDAGYHACWFLFFG